MGGVWKGNSSVYQRALGGQGERSASEGEVQGCMKGQGDECRMGADGKKDKG